MAQTVCLIVSAADRERLQAIIGDRQPTAEAYGPGAHCSRRRARTGAAGRGVGRRQPTDGMALAAALRRGWG